jgi:cellulose synthase/poly-beta-1,6-N-acetylglucosamine synthase-like glycosyltransferase
MDGSGLLTPELERAAGAQRTFSVASPDKKSPALFLCVFGVWALALYWFHPRLWSLTELGTEAWSKASIAYFVIFAELAWLYGIYNIAIVTFAAIYRAYDRERFLRSTGTALPCSGTPVAILYTTCNDFVENSARSCIEQAYSNFHLYILDDSSDPGFQARVDAFAASAPDRITVVRRPDRRAAKAGNLNHALAEIVREPLFAIVDADEILPPDFLDRLVPRLESDPDCGFVQANHRARKSPPTQLARDLGIGIDIHWKWYQPLRNRFGFVMFLGHGALIRRECWVAAGGFPEIVSEDLAFAIAIRDIGYHGYFAEDVVCEEEFPETVRAFRVRHVKWTRGTCEFLLQWTGRLLKSRRITTAEKLDILFPTLNLPMTFFFFLFMINAQFMLPLIIGQFRVLTLELGGQALLLPVMSLKPEVNVIFGPDFYAITMLTVLAPILCFIVELWRRPQTLVRFLTHSVAIYSALSPLTFICVVGFAATRKARFLVTADAVGNGASRSPADAGKFMRLKRFWSETHPDHTAVRLFELGMGIAFGVTAIATFQISFLGLSIAFMLMPLMHRTGWGGTIIKRAVWVPAILIFAGLGLGGLGLFGLQPVLFGFGFHF